MLVVEILIYGMAAISAFWLVAAVAIYVWFVLRWIGGAIWEIAGDLWG